MADVQRLGLVHRGMAGLVDHVVGPAEFGETFQGRLVEDRFGNSLGQRAYYEPPHLDIALGRTQYRLPGPEVRMYAGIEWAARRILPNLEQYVADFRGGGRRR